MNQNEPQLHDEIDLRELFRAVWDGKKLVVIITAFAALGSLIYALQVTKYYQSETIMIVRNNAQSQGILSQLSGAASLLGVNVSTSSDDKSMQAIQLIQSRNFVKHLLTFENVLPSVMAAKSYDLITKQLYFDQTIYDSQTKTWIGDPGKNGLVQPSYLQAHEVYMGDIMSIAQDRAGFISINIKHVSPVFAKEFLELITREANTILRKKDLEESSQALEYLRSELSKTSFVEIRESINTLIEAQLEIQMMANLNDDYILVAIEPPFIPEKNMKTNRLLIVIFTTMFGGLLGVIVVLLRHYLKGINLKDLLT